MLLFMNRTLESGNNSTNRAKTIPDVKIKSLLCLFAYLDQSVVFVAISVLGPLCSLFIHHSFTLNSLSAVHDRPDTAIYQMEIPVERGGWKKFFKMGKIKAVMSVMANGESGITASLPYPLIKELNHHSHLGGRRAGVISRTTSKFK